MADQVAKRTLDFTNVKEGSDIRPKRKPAGEYLATVVSVTDKESKQGNDMWVFVVKLDVDSTATYPIHCTLNEESLWKLRAFMMACGAAIGKKRINIDPNKFVNRQLGVILEDDEYDGKEKSVINGFIPKSELAGKAPAQDDDDDEDEEPEYEEEEPVKKPVRKTAAKAAARKPAAKKAAPVEDDEVEDDELDELDLDDL